MNVKATGTLCAIVLCCIAPLLHAEVLPPSTSHTLTQSGVSLVPTESPQPSALNPAPSALTASRLLKEMAGLAVQRSPLLRDAEAAWHAAQMDSKDASGGRWPRVDVTATSKAKMFGTNPYATDPPGRVGVTLTYNLFDGGKTGKQISSKDFFAEAAHAKYLQTREQTIFDTTSVYLQILKYRRLAELHGQHVQHLSELVNKIQDIVQVMAGRRSELTQAMSRLLQAKENRAAAETKLHEFEVQMVKLIGAENLNKTRNNVIPVIALLQPETGMESAKKSHQNLLGLEAERAALDDSATAIRRGNYWPVVELQASKQSGTDVFGYADPGQMFVMMKWNVFQGFSGMSQEAAVLERANAARERYQQTVLDIEYKLNSAWTDYQNQHERVESLRILAENTAQVRDDYFTQWETLGKRSLLEVLTAENEHISTLVSAVSSEIDEQLALTKLRFEAGALASWLLEN